jgi:hypothetical protein
VDRPFGNEEHALAPGVVPLSRVLARVAVTRSYHRVGGAAELACRVLVAADELRMRRRVAARPTIGSIVDRALAGPSGRMRTAQAVRSIRSAGSGDAPDSRRRADKDLPSVVGQERPLVRMHPRREAPDRTYVGRRMVVGEERSAEVARRPVVSQQARGREDRVSGVVDGSRPIPNRSHLDGRNGGSTMGLTVGVVPLAIVAFLDRRRR